MLTNEKELNDVYDRQAYLIKTIAKNNASGATINAKASTESLKSAKQDADTIEKKIRSTQSEAVAEEMIAKAKEKVNLATAEAAAIDETALVKKRNIALNEYVAKLREIEKEEAAVARETNKQKASIMNQTKESNDSISSKKIRIATLKAEAEALKDQTNTKYVGDASDSTEQYNLSLS